MQHSVSMGGYGKTANVRETVYCPLLFPGPYFVPPRCDEKMPPPPWCEVQGKFWRKFWLNFHRW